jgi:hypothetical protein
MASTFHHGSVKLFSIWLSISFLALEVCSGQGGKAYQAKVVEQAAIEPNAIPGCSVLWKQEQAIQKYVHQHPEVLSAIRIARRTAWNFQVDDRKAWWATNLVTNTEYQVPSTCRAVGTHAYYFVEDSLWNTGRVTQAQVDSVAAAFDLRTPASPIKGIYETDVETFGNPPDVDNDPKIIILILNINDGFTGTGNYVAGYFYSLNEFPEGTFFGHHSNDAEIYYVDANPTNLATSSGLGIAMETTAHEFQHMIHWNYDRNEITFMNEGCSMVAEVVCGFPVSFQSSYTSNTDVYLLQWNSGNEIPDYARAQRWVLYLWNQFPNGYLRLLVQNTGTGIAGINNALAQYSPTTSRRFDDIFKDWLVANELNDASVDPRYAYTYSGALAKPAGTKYLNPNTGTVSGSVIHLGADYIAFSNGSNLSITFTSGSPAIQVQAIETGPGGKRVINVPVSTLFSEPAFGTSYTNVTFLVLNSSQTADASYSYQATGTTSSTSAELKYDYTEPTGYLPNAAGDTVCVWFDGVPGAKLDSIRVALRRAGSMIGGVWTYTGNVRPSPLGTPLAVPMTATATSTPSVPYPVPWPNWATVDLRPYNLSADQAFAVAFRCEGTSSSSPRVMVTEVPTPETITSYTYSTASTSGPNWYVLTPNTVGDTVYIYLIRAYVHAGATSSGPTVATIAASEVTQTSATLNGTVNPNGVATSAWFEWGTSSTLATFSSTSQQSIGLGTGVSEVRVSLTGLSPSTAYYYRVVAQSSSGTVRSSITSFTTLPAYPSAISLSATIGFPSAAKASDYKPSDYKIIGLPGAGNISVTSLLSGAQNRDWQVFWDNGGSSDYLVPFDGSSEFQFSVGRAFWVVKRDSWQISGDVPSPPLNAASEAEIPIHSGWNLITDPFWSAIPWSSIQSVNNTSESIYTYSAGFTTSSSLDPYVGYYFFSDPTNPQSILRIPYASLFSGSSISNNAANLSWSVDVTLISGDVVDRGVSFGVSSNVAAGRNALANHKPRALPTVPIIEFYRPSWDPDYPFFGTDIRRESQGPETWEFDVQSPKMTPSRLVFSGVQRIPARFGVYLIDQCSSKYTDLRKDTVYSFTAVTEVTKFKVVVGLEGAIRDTLDSVQTKQFVLENNFPNPFNPTTVIFVDIPFETKVELRIYDILGREVTTLYDGLIEPGRHWFTWDGKADSGYRVSSGVYLCRLSTITGVSQVRKLVLTK